MPSIHRLGHTLMGQCFGVGQSFVWFWRKFRFVISLEHKLPHKALPQFMCPHYPIQPTIRHTPYTGSVCPSASDTPCICHSPRSHPLSLNQSGARCSAASALPARNLSGYAWAHRPRVVRLHGAGVRRRLTGVRAAGVSPPDPQFSREFRRFATTTQISKKNSRKSGSGQQPSVQAVLALGS